MDIAKIAVGVFLGEMLLALTGTLIGAVRIKLINRKVAAFERAFANEVSATLAADSE